MSGHITSTSRGSRVGSSASSPSSTSRSTSTWRATPWQACTCTERSPGSRVRPAGRASSAARSAWSQPSRVSVVGADGSSVSLAGSATASARWSSRVSRPRLDSNGWRTTWWLSSASLSAAPRRPARSAQRAGDGCGSQTCTSRRVAQRREQVDLGHGEPGVAEQREPRRQVERLGILAQRLDRVPVALDRRRRRRPARPGDARARAARRGRRPGPTGAVGVAALGPVGDEEGRCPAYDAKSPASRRATEKRRPSRRSASSPVSPCPRCRARVAAHGSSRQASSTSRSGQASASGAHGSSSRAPVISATSEPGDRNSTAAQTPSPAGPAPSTCESRWLSHRSIPRAGTTTSSLANGSGSGAASNRPSPSASASARTARCRWRLTG